MRWGCLLVECSEADYLYISNTCWEERTKLIVVSIVGSPPWKASELLKLELLAFNDWGGCSDWSGDLVWTWQFSVPLARHLMLQHLNIRKSPRLPTKIVQKFKSVFSKIMKEKESITRQELRVGILFNVCGRVGYVGLVSSIFY